MFSRSGKWPKASETHGEAHTDRGPLPGGGGVGVGGSVEVHRALGAKFDL